MLKASKPFKNDIIFIPAVGGINISDESMGYIKSHKTLFLEIVGNPSIGARIFDLEFLESVKGYSEDNKSIWEEIESC